MVYTAVMRWVITHSSSYVMYCLRGTLFGYFVSITKVSRCGETLIILESFELTSQRYRHNPMTGSNNIHALFHVIFIRRSLIFRADQALILSTGKLTFESDMWYWKIDINWSFHLTSYPKIIIPISVASTGNSQRYGNLCDVTGNHEIWDVTQSLRTYSHEGCCK